MTTAIRTLIAAVATAVVIAGCAHVPGISPAPAPAELVADWRRPDGAPAARSPRSFEVISARGPAHCDLASIVLLTVAWPPDLSMDTADGDTVAHTRQYVRDSADVLADGLTVDDLAVDVRLPDSATATGYQLPTAELWFGPDAGDRHAYIVRADGSVERWPRAVEHIACE